MSILPVNPRFMPATKNLLEQLYKLSGQWTLSGQANTISWLTRDTESIKDRSDCWPAVWSSDFGYSGDRNDDNYIGNRDGLIDEIARQHQAGSIIQLDFRPVNPVLGEPQPFQAGLVDPISDRDWEAMLTPGTSVFTRWRQQLDIIGVFLRYLKDMGIVVLFRPCHSMNSARYWWGGRPGPAGFPGLWRSIFDYYVHHLRMDNLLFVWSAEAVAEDPLDFYPGHDMVDILGCDFFESSAIPYPQTTFEAFQKMAGGRPVAMTRAGPIPDNEILARQRWLWFMEPAGLWENHHLPEELRMLYAGNYLLHRDDWMAPKQAH